MRSIPSEKAFRTYRLSLKESTNTISAIHLDAKVFLSFLWHKTIKPTFSFAHGIIVFLCLLTVLTAARAAPTPIYPGFNNYSVHSSVEAAWGSWSNWVTQYNDQVGEGGTHPYVCNLSDWSLDFQGLSEYYNSGSWKAVAHSPKCIHTTQPILLGGCEGGYQTLGGPNLRCECPANKPDDVEGHCYEKCPEGQFRGKKTLQCKPKCPAGTYLSTSGVCKPLPPCTQEPCLPPDDADPDAGLPDPCSGNKSGNPINTANGNKFQEETDFNWGPELNFIRYFNGSDKHSKGMPKGWRHNYSQNIRTVYTQSYQTPLPMDIDSDWEGGAIGTSVIHHYVLERPDGKSYNFTPAGVPLEVVPHNTYVLTILSNGFIVQDGINKESYNSNGQLIRLERLGRYVITAQYNSDNNLSQLLDSRGYRLDIGYDSFGLIHSVSVLNTILSARYTVDAQQRLTATTYSPKDFSSDPTTRQYLYEDTLNPFLLTGIIDENNNRYVTWKYDSQGRGIESKHAGDVDKVSLTFGMDGLNRYTDELDALGTTRRFTFMPFGKSWLKAGNSQPGGSGCNASSSSQSYDSNGNIGAQLDFNGNKTTYVFDLARNLETRRIEAAGTSYQRVIDTQWHSTLRLPIKITEPGRITEYTYDTRANVTLKKVTDTTQPTPVARSTTYTYVYNADANNPFIQKLTVDGPRIDVNDVTVYDYDTKGNLSTITRQTAANTTLITSYADYDFFGHAGTITAPNGVVTKLTYYSRGWLKTRVVGFGSATPLTTTFDYDAVGQLIKVTLPDSSTVTYTYDAAHRLTDIVDASGNRIHYTLDNAGNRIKEEVTDSSGLLAALLVQIQTAQADAQLPHAGEAI